MADLPTSPTPSTPQGKKELSMEMRLLIAFLLMGLVLFVTPYVYKPAPGPKPAPQTPTKTGEVVKPAESPGKPAETAKAATAAPAEMPGRIAATSEHELVIETDLYRIQFSNRGAVVRSWLLKKFIDQKGKPLELVNRAAAAKVAGPFSISMKDENTASAVNFAYFMEKPTEDKLGVDYEYSDGKTLCKKSFRFGQNSYLSQFSSEVSQNGIPQAHLIDWRGGFGDSTVLNRAQAQHSVYYDVQDSSLFSSSLKTNTAKDAKNGPIFSTGNYSFVGLDDLFFAFVMVPKDNTTTQMVTIKDEVPTPQSTKDESHVGVEIGGDSQNNFSLFVGPKDVDVLKKVDPKLAQLIEWGKFKFLAQPLFQVLHYLNDHVFHNYGWSIVGITIVINLLLLPLRLTGMKSARKMQALQPQIAAINAKYKNLSLRDPKKAEQNQEVMDLYKKHGANPLGGCLPMAFQLPFLYAFYTVLTVTIQLRGATWLWVTDLSQPETLALHILPLVMIATQFIMQKITPNPSVDPAQAKMMQFMPLMFGFFFYNMSSGLVLYWLTGNLVGIAQQYLMNKYMPAPIVPQAPQKKVVKR